MSHNHYHMYDLCKKHMHAYVLAELEDGMQVDGIITDVDDDNVYLAVPIELGMGGPGNPGHMNNPCHHGNPHDHRVFGFGYPGYGYGYPGYGYGYGYRPRRRFNRLVLPLAALTAISLLPWY
ncbi:hypothetical protein ACFO3D_13970 [Virgibacillus kekensis]|uniref:Uncharacterized protein n=1 Tax=Virgibacillus kekensis TaxID=202261 RepID=A0ABV9DLT7_9BACI